MLRLQMRSLGIQRTLLPPCRGKKVLGSSVSLGIRCIRSIRSSVKRLLLLLQLRVQLCNPLWMYAHRLVALGNYPKQSQRIRYQRYQEDYRCYLLP